MADRKLATGVETNISSIVESVFHQGWGKALSSEPTPEEIASAFQKLEALGQPAFDPITRSLRDPNSSEVKLLKSVGEPAYKYLVFALETGSEREKETAISIISGWGDEISIPKLREFLWSEVDTVTRQRIVSALLEKGDDGLEVVISALHDEKSELRQTAAHTLGLVVMSPVNRAELVKYERHIELLFEVLNDPDKTTRYHSAHALAYIERLSLDNIEIVLNDEDVQVREIGLRALFNLGITFETPAKLLAIAIEDSHRKIVDTAIEHIAYDRCEISYEVMIATIINELVLRDSDRPDELFNSNDVAQAIKKGIEKSPRVLGQSLQRLCNIAYQRTNGARRRSVLVGAKISKDEFLALINERSQEDPAAAQAIRQLLGIDTNSNQLIQQLYATEPGDVQGIAATQIGLLKQYYEDALKQANTSFWWATGAMSLGLLCLIAFLVYFAWTGLWNFASLLPIVGNLFSNFIAYQQLQLYQKTREQLSDFQRQMDQTQRFLLANSVCETLEGDMKAQTRADLVKWIATFAIDNELPFESTKDKLQNT